MIVASDPDSVLWFFSKKLWDFVNLIALHRDMTVACPPVNAVQTMRLPSTDAPFQVSISFKNLPAVVHIPEPSGSCLYCVQRLWMGLEECPVCEASLCHTKDRTLQPYFLLK